MSKKMDLSIIIVTYNSASHINALLTSIKKSSDKLKKEVIIVDNASSDTSLRVARSHPIKPIVISSSSNLGFARAVNLGIKKSRGQQILLLNPDTRVVGNSLTTLHDFASESDTLGAVVPRLLDMNNRPQASVFRFPTILNAIKKYFFNCSNCFQKYLPPNKLTKVEVAVMAAFMVPRSTFNQVGMLDERYFLYYEDIEFCKRLKKSKLPVYYLPQAKIKHAHGASGSFKSHLNSPLLKSAQIYHGALYSTILNLVLLLGQKWQKTLKNLPYIK